MPAKQCWYCQHFIPDNPETLVSGICARRAPKGADYQSLYTAKQNSFWLDIGHIIAAGTIQSGSALPLHIAGYGAGPASCHAADTTGLSAADILPFSIPLFDTINVAAWALSASLLNSGAASVGSAPILHLYQIRVNNGDQTVLNEIPIPIAPANVGINGNVTDLFVNTNGIFTTPVALSPGCCGFRLDLTQTGEDDISEVRNLKMGLLVMGSSLPETSSAEISKSKYAAITDGTAVSCGEFRPLSE